MELKKALNGGSKDFAIALNGGVKSRKTIRLDDKGRFAVENHIDGSVQALTEAEIYDSRLSNIGKAMLLDAFYVDD